MKVTIQIDDGAAHTVSLEESARHEELRVAQLADVAKERDALSKACTQLASEKDGLLRRCGELEHSLKEAKNTTQVPSTGDYVTCVRVIAESNSYIYRPGLGVSYLIRGIAMCPKPIPVAPQLQSDQFSWVDTQTLGVIVEQESPINFVIWPLDHFTWRHNESAA